MSNIDERNTDYNTSGRLEDDKIDIIAILLDMWKGVRKFWLLLLIIAIVCAGIFFAYNKYTRSRVVSGLCNVFCRRRCGFG